MTTRIGARFCALIYCLLAGAPAQASGLEGYVFDPAHAPVSGARVAAMNRVGVVRQSVTDAAGRFNLPVLNSAGMKIVITATGFATRRITIDGNAVDLTAIELSLAPQSDSVSVVGSAIDVSANELGTSLSVISGPEIRERNEALSLDLLRYLPGLFVTQGGARGTVGAVSIRGGDTKYNLVQIDGVTVNSFYYGGYFDFSQVPSDFLSRIEVARGPQSAIYGSYANSGVISFSTRSVEDGPRFDIVAEGGTYGERRFALSGSGIWMGLGIAGSASRLDYNGPVVNSDYFNENVFLSVQKRWANQSLFASGNYDANETGEPGPYGSDPAHNFTGIDTVSRSGNYFSNYSLHYTADLTPRVRQEVFGGFFLNNSPYLSPFGNSFSKDIRGMAEARTTFSVNHVYTMAAGFEYTREEVKNTYITDFSSREYPLRRDEEGLYWDNQFHLGPHLFINAGIRQEIFQQPLIPPSPYRPSLPGHAYGQTNPKVAAAYLLGRTRLHSSFGTGIRPPGGADLAFTDNPDLKPERNISVDAGVAQRFFGNRASFDATYFYSRYTDQIVGLGGDLAVLNRFQTANLARSRSEGFELTAQLHPVRWFSINGNYTYLATAVLSLKGSGESVQQYYRVGQELPRRPANSGSLVCSLQYRKISANILGYFRGQMLDVEPNFGVSGGFYTSPGYQNIGLNLNYAVGKGVTVYGNLRNLLNQRYEELLGFPAPILNFVAGVKWSLPRGSK